jgi:hypothetical protein
VALQLELIYDGPEDDELWYTTSQIATYSTNIGGATVIVRIGPALENNNLRLATVGASVIPEFPAADLMIALAFAAIVAATLAVMKRRLRT